MEDDWGASATAPTFSLFKRVTPQQAAESGAYVDPTLYNTWNKSDRRLFRRLKTQQIAEQLARDELNNLDELTSAFDTLNLFRSDNIKQDDVVDDLINQIERLKVDAEKLKADGVKKELRVSK